MPVPNPQLPTISLEGFIIELKTIIRDQCVQDSKLGDDIPLDKPHSIRNPDVSKWLSFYPFGKIVRFDEEPPLVPYSLGK